MRDRQVFALAPHRLRLIGGLRPQFVIDGRSDKFVPAPLTGAKRAMEAKKQTDRITAARNGDEDTAWPCQPVEKRLHRLLRRQGPIRKHSHDRPA